MDMSRNLKELNDIIMEQQGLTSGDEGVAALSLAASVPDVSGDDRMVEMRAVFEENGIEGVTQQYSAKEIENVISYLDSHTSTPHQFNYNERFRYEMLLFKKD